MARPFRLAPLALILAAAPLAAQSNSQCGGFVLERARNVCNAAIDGSRLFTPVAGLLLSGGNAVLGSGEGLGGFPSFSFSLRAAATQIVIPDLDYDGIGRTVGAEEKITAPAPQLDVAVGLYGGTAAGNFAIDLLGAAQLLPTDQIDDVRVDDDATAIGGVALGLGWGARVTLLGERRTVPAITVSGMRRSLPRIDVGSVPDGDRWAFGTDLTATNWRAVVSKHVGPLLLGAGVGRDSYKADAVVTFRDPLTDVPQAPIALTLEDERTLTFLNAGFDLGAFKLTGEVGWQQGKDLGLGTTFTDNDPKARRMFGGASLRFAF